MDAHAETKFAVSAQRAEGSGRLSVISIDGQTRLKNLYQQGCAKLRIPKRPDAEVLEAVMINTSGGMTGGDRLDWEFEAGPETDFVITTQACEKIYKSSEGAAETNIRITAGTGSKIAWLPQETILFDRSVFARSISVNLEPLSEGLFVEPMIFGRQSMGEAVTTGSITDRWIIRQDGHPIHVEAFRLSGRVKDVLAKRAVSDGVTALATVLLVSPTAETMIDAARRLIGDTGGASCWNGKLLARLVAKDGYQLRKRLVPLVRLLNRDADLPKVWAT